MKVLPVSCLGGKKKRKKSKAPLNATVTYAKGEFELKRDRRLQKCQHLRKRENRTTIAVFDAYLALYSIPYLKPI
jgi:hypothetical protein